MADKAALHDYLAQVLELPAYYGKNLDALYDCLTEISQPLTLVLPAAALKADYLNGYGAQLAETMQDAASENENLKIIVE